MKGENFVLYPCFISLALGIFLLSIAHSTWLILLSAVFVGLGYGTFMSNGQAVTVKIVPVQPQLVLPHLHTSLPWIWA